MNKKSLVGLISILIVAGCNQPKLNRVDLFKLMKVGVANAINKEISELTQKLEDIKKAEEQARVDALYNASCLLEERASKALGVPYMGHHTCMDMMKQCTEADLELLEKFNKCQSGSNTEKCIFSSLSYPCQTARTEAYKRLALDAHCNAMNNSSCFNMPKNKCLSLYEGCTVRDFLPLAKFLGCIEQNSCNVENNVAMLCTAQLIESMSKSCYDSIVPNTNQPI